MRVLITEIKLKSGEINEEMILPRYYNKGIAYNGEFYKKSAMIKDLLPQKALIEIKTLTVAGSALDFETDAEIKNWIVAKTGINDCSLSAL